MTWLAAALSLTLVVAVLTAGRPFLTDATAAPPTGSPTAPLNVQAVAGNTTATVTWAPPTSTGSSAITNYVVTAAPGGVTTTVAAVTATVIGSLTNGVSYTFTVAARNSAGTGPPSAPSNVVMPSGPAVTRLTPNTGRPAGGTSVTISGTGFTGVSAVQFGANSAVSYTVVSPTAIVATAPPGTVGQALVQVTTGSGPTPALPASTFTYTPYDHIFTIMMENQDYPTIIGPSGPAYINGLASQHGLATAYASVTHPSLGNYLALTSGDTFAATAQNDCPPTGSGGCPISAPNLAANRLDPAGLSWKAYQESMPAACSLSDSPDGLYLAHHDPFAYYTNLQGSAECAANVVNYAALSGSGGDLSSATTTPNYVWITPNANDDMHNGTVSAGDTWLSQNVPLILNSPAFTQQSSLLFITWDEDATNTTTGAANHVATIVIPSGPARHIATATPYTHYSMLKTVETAWGLSPLTTNDAGASPMTDLLTPPPPPAISSVSPTSGPSAGGTVVTITGSNFAGTTAVTFGGAAATNVSWNAAGTQLTVTTPPGSGQASLSVSAPGGTITTAPGIYTYTAPPPPSVSSISPSTGPAGGGTSVTISGSNFTGATGVSFGGTPATNVSVNGPGSQVTALSPAGSGTVDVTVTTPGGTSPPVAGDRFTYQAASTSATIAAVGSEYSATQSSGQQFTLSVTPVAAGDVLELAIETKFTSGPSFTAASVSGGGVSTWTKAVSFLSADGIHGQELWWGVVTSPGQSTINVTYTQPSTSTTFSSLDAQEFSSSAGASTVWSVDKTGSVDSSSASSTLRYPSLTPTGSQEMYWGYLAVNGSLSGGSTSGCTYQFDSRDNQVVYCLPVSSSISPTSPSASPSSQTWASIALLMKASTTAPSAPTVSGVNPSTGPAAGGTAVTISGANFTGATSVTFGGVAAGSFTVNSSTQVSATAPAGSGTVAVAVTAAGGTGSLANAFTYLPAPTVSAVSPSSGPAAGGTSVTISGTNLSGATAVSFGGVAATAFTVNSATQITATTPAGSGTVAVAVTTPGGTVSKASAFSYIAAPTLSSASPSSGPTAGGTTVTIAGNNLSGATAVTFGGVAATAFTVNSATQITATTPAGSGTVAIGVTTPGGSTSLAGAYTYTSAGPSAPTVSSVAPSSGPAAGGTPVTITGSNFTGATSVTFGGVGAAAFTVTGPTQISATTPAGSGTVAVAVTTPGGTAALGNAYTYTAAPSSPVAAGAVFAQDTFARATVTGGWGTATDGHAWTVQSGAASVLSVSGNQGLVKGSNSMATARLTLGSSTSGDTEVVDRYTSKDYANDAGHLLLRYSSASSFYVAGLDSPVSGAEINVMRESGGTETRVASIPFSATNGTAYWQRARITTSGSSATVQVRVWQDGTSEPSTWNLTYTDAAPLPAGMAGIESWDDGAGWAIDHFSAGNLSVATSAPVFTAASPSTSATTGIAYSYTFAASGSPAPTFSLASGSLPPGLTLTSAGVLSGTPTTAGSYVFSVAASNSAGTATTPTYTLTVATGATAPVFTADSPPSSATTGIAYSYTFTASGSPAPTFSLASGSLPPGLTLTSAGVLSGTPTTTGSFIFSVAAANSAGTTVSPSLTITVSTGTSAPAFTASNPPASATTGAAYSYTFTASGSPAPTFAVASGSLPPGLALSTTGLLSGTPTTVGSFTFSVSAANSVGTAFTSNLTITVSAAPSFPTAGGTVFAADTFARSPVGGGWGTATDGHAWTLQSGSASDLSVAGNQGLVKGSNSMATARLTLGSSTSLNTDLVDRYTSQDYANDAGHLLFRYSSSSSFYVAGLDSPVSGAEINVMKTSGGAQTRVASVAFAATNGTAYWQRVRITNAGSSATIQVRVWADGTAEPSTWNLTWTDTSALPAGTAGIESWDDGQGWAIDHFSAGSLP